MMLRPRQALLVERSLAALYLHGNTLAIGPTGSGKTIMLSAVAGGVLEEPDAKACILAHRDELTAQNREKFGRVNPGVATSVFDAKEKSWAGRATFAMVQTLSRDAHLDAMPTLDLLVVDEAHHAASPSYRRVIDRVLSRNPRALIFGATATPARSDGKGLREVFSNVADQIPLGELIASGHLVPPRTFVIDVGAQSALAQVRRTATDFDMTEVEAILNRTPITDAVIRHWREKAGERKTIVFCSTVAHAQCVADAFVAASIRAVLIHGELSDAERKVRLAEYESGEAQVVVNVAVLTEGYDYTPTSCVVLLRPSSHKSTLTQMIGRGCAPSIRPSIPAWSRPIASSSTSAPRPSCTARWSRRPTWTATSTRGRRPPRSAPPARHWSRSAAANAHCAASSGPLIRPSRRKPWTTSS